jgi:hypothetical protein
VGLQVSCVSTRTQPRRRVEEKPKRHKTSLVIDRAKVERVKEILGTKTITETVDAALDDVINHSARMQLLERIKREGGIGPGPEELRRLREPRMPP